MIRDIDFSHWSLTEYQATRWEHSFIDADPFWSYAYILWTLGKSDPKLTLQQDVTAIIYVGKEQCHDVSKDTRLGWVMAMLDSIGAENWVSDQQVNEAIGPSDNLFPDIVFAINLGNDFSKLYELKKSLDNFDQLTQFRAAFGIHAFSAIQLLAMSDKVRILEDETISQSLQRTALPLAH